jgi:hypothetical protein
MHTKTSMTCLKYQVYLNGEITMTHVKLIWSQSLHCVKCYANQTAPLATQLRAGLPNWEEYSNMVKSPLLILQSKVKTV